MAKKRVRARRSASQQLPQIEKPSDIVNNFLTMSGRILFHYGKVTSRRFVTKNKLIEEGFWYGDVTENAGTPTDENQRLYKIPYKLTAVLGAPIPEGRHELNDKT